MLSNAVVQGGGPQRLDLDLRHGLFVVDRLAVRRGSRPTGRGKAVWADLGPAAS